MMHHLCQKLIKVRIDLEERVVFVLEAHVAWEFCVRTSLHPEAEIECLKITSCLDHDEKMLYTHNTKTNC